MNEDPQTTERYEQFLTLFAQHHERLMGFIYSLVPSYQDAEDVFQKTSLVLWRKFEQVRPDGDFYTWACKVAYFEVRNHRRVYARDRLFFNEDLLETLAEQRATSQGSNSCRMTALQDCMSGLNESQQELVRKAYGEGRSMGQLATELGRAVQTIYNRLYRIRRVLFDCVQQKLAAEETLS